MERETGEKKHRREKNRGEAKERHEIQEKKERTWEK